MDGSVKDGATSVQELQIDKLEWVSPQLISEEVGVNTLVADAPLVLRTEYDMEVDDLGVGDAATTILWEPKMLKDVSQAQWMLLQEQGTEAIAHTQAQFDHIKVQLMAVKKSLTPLPAKSYVASSPSGTNRRGWK